MGSKIDGSDFEKASTGLLGSIKETHAVTNGILVHYIARPERRRPKIAKGRPKLRRLPAEEKELIDAKQPIVVRKTEKHLAYRLTARSGQCGNSR